jgi:hypothetical protein
MQILLLLLFLCTSLTYNLNIFMNYETIKNKIQISNKLLNSIEKLLYIRFIF